MDQITVARTNRSAVRRNKIKTFFSKPHNVILLLMGIVVTITTIAPTGTLSIIAGVSSGVEPVFAYAYIRNVMDGTHLIETNQILKDRLVEAGIYSDELMHKIVEQGSLAHVDGIPEDIRRVFVCAHDVSPIWHVKMQAAFQRYTDNAVSKTVNFPNSATKEEVGLLMTNLKKEDERA